MRQLPEGGRSIVATRLQGGPLCPTTSSGTVRPAGSSATSPETGSRSATAMSRHRRSAIGLRGDHQIRTSKGSPHSADGVASLAAPAGLVASMNAATPQTKRRQLAVGAAPRGLRPRFSMHEPRRPRGRRDPLRIANRSFVPITHPGPPFCAGLRETPRRLFQLLPTFPRTDALCLKHALQHAQEKARARQPIAHRRDAGSRRGSPSASARPQAGATSSASFGGGPPCVAERHKESARPPPRKAPC